MIFFRRRGNPYMEFIGRKGVRWPLHIVGSGYCICDDRRCHRNFLRRICLVLADIYIYLRWNNLRHLSGLRPLALPCWFGIWAMTLDSLCICLVLAEIQRASLFFDLGSLFFNLTSFFRPWITFFDLGSLFLDLDLLFLNLGMFLLTLAYFPILVWNLAPSCTFSLCVCDSGVCRVRR